MRKQFVRVLSLLMALALCVPMLLTALATEDAGGVASAQAEGALDPVDSYEDLYVTDVDGDGVDDITFFYDAYSHTANDGKATSITDKNGNVLSLTATYTEKGFYQDGNDQINLSGYYDVNDAETFVEYVISQTGERSPLGTNGSMYVGPAKISVYWQNNVGTANQAPIDESYGIVSRTYWYTTAATSGNVEINTDRTSTPTRFLGAPTGEIYSVGVALKKDLTAGSYSLAYVRDCVTVAESSKPAKYDASADTNGVKFGYRFLVNCHAIRLYNKVLDEAQIRQNHFADLAGYLGLDLTAFNTLSAEQRAELYVACADIALTDADAKAKVEAEIAKFSAGSTVSYEDLYVTDVNGDGVDDITFFYDAYSHTANDGTATSITDKNGNNLTLPSGSTYTDKGFYTKGVKFSLASFYDISKDVYLEMVISQTGNLQGSNNGTQTVGPTKFSVYFNGTPVDESYGVLSSTSWITGGYSKFDTATTPRFLGGATGEAFTFGVGVAKDLDAMTFDNYFVRDCSIINQKTVTYTKETTATLEFGTSYCVNYHAIRLYTAIPTEAQMKQNHFADLAGYLGLDLTAFNKLSAEQRAELYVACADIALTDADAKAKVEAEIAKFSAGSTVSYEDLYVTGAGIEATLLWNAFDKNEGDTVSESAFSVNGSASYGNGYLFNNSAALDLTAYLPNFQYGDYIAQKDFTVEIVMSARPVDGTGEGNSFRWYFGNYQAAFKYRQKDNPNLSLGILTCSFNYLKDFVAGVTDNSGFNINTSATSFNVFGNTLNQAYTQTFTFDLTLGETPNTANDTMELVFYRDGEKLEHPASITGPLAYDAAKENTSDRKNDSLIIGGQAALEYYAIRVYEGVLTEEQIWQNHFADLAGFANVSNLSVFAKLSDESKTALYEQFSAVKLTDGEDREALKTTIENAISLSYVIESGITAEDFVSFLGYQVRLVGNDPGLRSLYCLNATELEGVTLLEIGAIMAIADGYTLADLTPENAAKGVRMSAATVYKNGDYVLNQGKAPIFATTVDGEEKSCFAYTTMYNSDTAASHYSTEMLYRAYVTLEYEGMTVTLYTDMTTESVDKVSLLSVTEAVVARNGSLKSNGLVKRVLESEIGQYANSLSSLEESLDEAAEARLSANAEVLAARTRAVELKEAIKNIAAEGNGASEDEQQALIAKIATLLADVADIKAQANTSFPDKSAELEAIASEAEDVDALIALVDQGSELRARIAALIERVRAEQAAYETFAANTAFKKSDALDALSVAECVGARMTAGDFSEVKTLKVLSIGNSFSNNATSQLYEIAKQFDYEDIVIGVLYIGGCSIEMHYNNALSGAVAYDYRKNTSGKFRTLEAATMLDGVTDEEWDFITFQQVSQLSAVESSLTDGKLDYLIKHVQENMISENTKLYYHATWSYAEGNGHSYKDKTGYEFLKNQALMDSMILDCMNNAILTRDDIDGVIYAGVSIAEAREHFGNGFELYSSSIKEGVETDGYHLNVKGCYVAGLTWFGTLTGEDVSKATATSTCDLSGDDLTAAINAAVVGVTHIPDEATAE